MKEVFCKCGRLSRIIQKNLKGEDVYKCFVNNHIFTLEELKKE